MPYGLDEVYTAVSGCSHFISVGTSGSVYPAAGLVDEARHAGARTIELNLEPSENTWAFDETRYGKASDILPDWVDAFLNGLQAPDEG